MISIPTDNGFFLRLDPGEDVLKTLTDFLRTEEIGGAILSGIGTLRKTILGYFDLPRQTYLKREYPEDVELVAFSGNVTTVDGGPFVHAHVLISGSDFTAQGGHLFGGEIAVTGEFFVWPTGGRIQRALDERSGLKLVVS
jgi:uncharacterized protein